MLAFLHGPDLGYDSGVDQDWKERSKSDGFGACTVAVADAAFHPDRIQGRGVQFFALSSP
jgi:hypothetical protein